MSPRPVTFKGLGDQRLFTTDSVERALTVHFGEGHRGWMTHPDGGWTVCTAVGIVHLRTLREAAIFVTGAAETKRRVEAA